METDDVAKADAPSNPSTETEAEARDWVYGAGGGLADAEGGDAAAQRRLGLLYLNGVGVGKKDFDAAENWLAKAHDQGDELAGGGLFLLRFGARARFSQAIEMLPSLKGAGLDLALDIFFEAVVLFEKLHSRRLAAAERPIISAIAGPRGQFDAAQGFWYA